MKSKKDKGLPIADGELRLLAEEQLMERAASVEFPRNEAETQRLVHELEVHQIELEMQSEELRHAQEKLELSRDKYSELYDFAPVGYFTFDAGGLIQEINLAGASLLGIERELITNIPLSRFIADAKGRKVFSGHLKNVLQKNGIQGCELKLTQKNGQVIHTQIQSTALAPNSSQGRDILSSIVDVTVAKELESEIQEAREYAENIVETLRAPLVVLDSDLKILTANHCFYETFKVTPEETVGNFIYAVGNRQWDIPQLRVLVEEILPRNTVIKDYEVEHDFPGIGRKNILLSARQIFREKIGSDIILLAMEDITERKQAESALIQAGALQSAIFHSANFSSIATDEKGVIQIFNVGAERMLGYTAAEVVNKNTPADISDPQEIITRAQALSVELETPITPGFDAMVFKARRGIEDIYELTYIRKDGSRFPAVVSVTALRDDQETIIGYLLIGTDNTARKKAEEALLQAGALQRAIFNSANFSSIATDAKGVIQIFNVGAERMLGYTAAEVMNKITPADISDPQEVIARAKALSLELDTKITPGFGALVFKARRGIEDIYELTYIRKDGSRFPAVVSVTALRDEQGAIIGYLLIGTDNTARKQASEYARSLIEASLDPLITINAEGKITDVNEGSIKVTGVPRQKLVGTDFSSYFTEPERAREAYREAFSKGAVTDYPLTIRHEDGRLTDVLYNASVYKDVQGNVLGVFAAARDVTERKRLDKVLQEKNVELENARSVAEKANLAKSDFLSSMSHELRTPLSAILGFAQLMESGKPEPTPTQRKSIDQILKAGWYLLALINEILDLALIESGKLAMSLEPVSLKEVLRECELMVEPQAQERNIQVIFKGIKAPCLVKADRTRVKQILLNLLSNAIKYNKKNGTITVSCTPTPGEFIRISVRDTGAGLTPEQLTQLFQPFNRLGQKGDVEEGTGIGLVVCKRLVESMGGGIGVESMVGDGCVFWFELIRTTEQQTSTQADQFTAFAEADSQADEQLSTLLYVEDNPANLMLVEDLLARRADIRFLSAQDAMKGVEIARTCQPDVILMDINLPGISGIDALKILANIPETALIPVVAISANAIPRDIERGLEAGFFRYLTKPIQVAEFMDMLDITLKHVKTEAAIAADKGKTKP